MEIKTVGVLGCGLMGSGIAQVCAAAGYKTIVREVEEGFLKKGLGRIEKFLTDGIAKAKVTSELKDATLANLSGTTKFEDLKGCDLIIEAIIENVDEKARTFAALDSANVLHDLAHHELRDGLTGDVRCDDDAWMAPEHMLWGQRLVGKNIQHCAADLTRV